MNKLLIGAICTVLFLTGCMPMSTHVKESRALMSRVSRDLKKKYGVVRICFGGAMMGDIQKIRAGYLAQGAPEVKEARELYVKLVEEVYAEVNASQKVRPYLREYPFERDRLDISLSFEVGRDLPLPDKIAYVHKHKGMVFYCIYNPSERKLNKVFQEPYDKALSIVNKH